MKTTVTKLSIVAATALALFITSCGDKKSSGSSASDTPDSVTDELLVKMDAEPSSHLGSHLAKYFSLMPSLALLIHLADCEAPGCLE